MARALVLAVAACALTGCAKRIRIELTPVPGAKPASAIVRCRTVGIDVAKVTWTLGPAVRQIGLPHDEAALLIQWTENAPPAQLQIACTVEDAKGARRAAGTSIAPPVITRAAVAGNRVTVEGSGFGAPLGVEDGVWLFSARGALRADAACKGASWDDKKIVACAPVGAAGRMELRVATGGKLAARAVDVSK